MEGIAGAAAVLQVISLGVKLGKEIYKFRENWKEGPDFVKNIEADLRYTLEMLNRFQTAISNPKRYALLANSSQLKSSEGLIDQIMKHFIKLSELLMKYDKIGDSAQQKMHWALHGMKETKNLGDSLAAHKAAMTLTMTFMNNDISDAINDKLDALTKQSLDQALRFEDNAATATNQRSAIQTEMASNGAILDNLDGQSRAIHEEVTSNSSRLEDLAEQGASIRDGVASNTASLASLNIQSEEIQKGVATAGSQLSEVHALGQATRDSVADNGRNIKDVLVQGEVVAGQNVMIQQQCGSIQMQNDKIYQQGVANQNEMMTQMNILIRFVQQQSQAAPVHRNSNENPKRSHGNTSGAIEEQNSFMRESQASIQTWLDNTSQCLTNSEIGSERDFYGTRTIATDCELPMIEEEEENEEAMTKDERRSMLMREILKEANLEVEQLDRERKAREMKFRKISRALKLVVSKGQSLHELLPLADSSRLNLSLTRPVSEPPILEYGGFEECIKFEPKYLKNFSEIELLIERELLAMHHQVAEEYCELATLEDNKEKHDFYAGLAENLFVDLEVVHDEFTAATDVKFEWEDPEDEATFRPTKVREMSFMELVHDHLLEKETPHGLFHQPVYVDRPRTRAKTNMESNKPRIYNDSGYGTSVAGTSSTGSSFGFWG